MKAKTLGLQTTVVGSYDKTKTTVSGRAAQKTINSVSVIGAPLTQFIDVFTASGSLTVGGVSDCTPNDRLWVISSIAAAQFSLMAYSFNTTTGAYSYLGRVLVNLPNTAATTHAPRALRVLDSNTSNIKVVIGTVGSVVINGGIFVINKLALTDLTTGPSPIIIQMAISSDVRGVYMHQDPSGLGVSNNITTLMGFGVNNATSELLLTNGTAASFTQQGFDLTIAPTITTYTTTAPTSGTATWSAAGHPFVNNDPVVFTTTGAAPGGFTASTAVVHQVYFARNVVAGVSFELSATSGGASITASSTGSGTFASLRAFGSTTATWLTARKTGTITSGFAGTALLLDNQRVVTIADGANAGQVCYWIATSTNFYCWRITDITSGATSLPTASAINVLGTGIDYTAISSLIATYSETLGKNVYLSSVFNWFMKSWVNSNITNSFGGQLNRWLENTPSLLTDYFRAMTANGITEQKGWLFVTDTTVGQRGVCVIDLRSDASFDYSSVVSPVIYFGKGNFNSVSTIEQLFDLTEGIHIYYRSASTSGDALFNSISGSWSEITVATDLSAVAFENYVQFKILFDVATPLSGTPSQIQDIVANYTNISDISDNWVGSVDNTSTGSPSRSAFRLQAAYATSVPTLYFRAYDDSDVLVASANTAADPTLFEYSTNNGTSWNSLGTIPNTPLTTELRYLWSSPPGSKVRVSIREN